MNLKIVTRVGVGLCDALAEWTITKQDTVTIGPNIGTKMIPTPIKKNIKKWASLLDLKPGKTFSVTFFPSL